jgi:hypothetical protein
MPELRTGREVAFELGYVGYRTEGTPRNPLTHAISIHWIDNKYHQYDGMQRGGALRQLGDAEEPPASIGEADYVVYFRM